MLCCRAAGTALFALCWDDTNSFGEAIREVIFMNQKKTEPSPPSPGKIERPNPPKIYPVIDNDLARDNVENDLAAADLQELQ